MSWKSRLSRAVSPLSSGVAGLEVLSYRDAQSERPSRTAAVLIPFLDRDEPELVLTRRADHLPTHPGQVSFPGGAVESQDRSAVHTAVREAHEEIGLPPDTVTPIGFLDRMDTISDYRVLPVVALVRHTGGWVLDETEVAEVFTVPMDIALDRRRYQASVIEHEGIERTIYSLDWAGHHIWGATARMLINLIHRLEAGDDR